MQYLESLDAVQQRPDSGGLAPRDRLRLIAETVTTLAMGQDIVVPQPYAVGSLGFMYVAHCIFTAQDNADVPEEDHPIRINFYDAASYTAAMADMLRRIDDRGDGPAIVSSLFPELHHFQGHEASARARRLEASLNGQVLVHGLHDYRSKLVPEVWAKLRDVDNSHPMAVPTQPTNPVPPLQNIVNAAIQTVTRGSRFIGQLDEDERQKALELAEALATLRRVGNGSPVGDKIVEDVFATRSWVHSTGPWPGSQTKAADIVGPSALKLVTEFVDSAYNARLAGTVGAHFASLSSPVVGTDSEGRELGFAQELAIRFASTAPSGSPPPDQAPTTLEQPYQFAMRVEYTPSRTTEDDAIDALIRSYRSALVQVFRMRADEEFKASRDAVDDSLRRRDSALVRQALERHVHVVGAGLADYLEVEGDTGRVGLVARVSTEVTLGLAAHLLGAGLWASLLVPIVGEGLRHLVGGTARSLAKLDTARSLGRNVRVHQIGL